MINYIIGILLLFFIASDAYSKNGYIGDSLVDYMVISSIGPVSGSSSISPLVISTKKIDFIEFDNNSYEEKRKYYAFENKILSEDKFLYLFDYLKQTSIDVVREEGFINSGLILIVDYRKKKNEDYVLLSFYSFSAVMFFINKLYCFMRINEFPEGILFWMKELQIRLIRGYNAENYKDNLECE